MAMVISSQLASSHTVLSFRDMPIIVLANINMTFDVSLMRIDALEAA
jgi:hypothetical protein